MITEADLHAVLAEEARDIREPTDLLTNLDLHRHPRARRQWIVPAAAAAVVAAVAVIAIALAGTRHANEQPGGQLSTTLDGVPAQELRSAVTIGHVDGYEMSRPALGPGTVSFQVRVADSHKVAGDLTVYGLTDASRFAPDADTVRHGRQVQVQGHRGYFYAPDPAKVAALMWEYAPQRWAVLQGWSTTGPDAVAERDPLTEEMKIGQAVNFNASEPLMLPFAVRHLPAHLYLLHGDADVAPDAVAELFLQPTGNRAGLLHVRFDASASAKSFSANTTVDGHRAMFSAGDAARATQAPATNGVGTGPVTQSPSLTVDLGPAVVVITGQYSRTELIKIAESIQLAPNADDPTTWFNAAR